MIRKFFRRPTFYLDREVELSVRGVPVRMGVISSIENYRVKTYESKEPETLDWIDQNFQGDRVFYDVGANIGVYSIYAAIKNPSGKVYAFEPESRNFIRLCENIARNRLSNVVPCNFPLSNQVKVDFFHVGETKIGSALHSFGRPSALRSPQSAPVRLGMIGLPLDDLIGKFHFPFPNLLKIDVDGNESEIIQGAAHTLKTKDLKTLLIEINLEGNGRTSELKAEIEKADLRLTRTSDWVSQFEGFTSQNHIFDRTAAKLVP